MARRGSSNFTVHANMESKGFQRGVRSMGVEVRQFASSGQRDLRTLSGELGLMGGRFGGLTRAATGAFSGMSAGAKTAAIGIAGVTVAVGALAAAYQTADRASKQFATIDTLRRRTAVAAGGNFQRNLPGAGALGQGLATEYGIAEEQIQPALYDAFATTGGWKEAEDLVRIAARNFWLAGVDLQTTAKTFTDNAKLFNISTEEYADATAFITRISKLTPEDVGRFAPQFLGRGQSLGIGLREQLAMFGTATSRFRPEQASTRLGEFFNALADPNHKLTKAFSDFAGTIPAHMDDLVGELADFRESIGDDAFSALAVGSVGDIAKALTDSGVFMEMKNKMSSGIEGVFNEMSDFVMRTEELKQKSIDEQFKEIWKNWGEQIAPELNEFKQSMMDLATQVLPTFGIALTTLGGTMEVIAAGARRGADLALDTSAYFSNLWEKGPISTAWWGGGADFGGQGVATGAQMSLDRILDQASRYVGENWEDFANRGTGIDYTQVDAGGGRTTTAQSFTAALGFTANQVNNGIALAPFNQNAAALAESNVDLFASLFSQAGITDPATLRAIAAESPEFAVWNDVADRMEQVEKINSELLAEYRRFNEMQSIYLPKIADSTEGTEGNTERLAADKERATYYSPITTADFLAQGV